MVHYLLSSLLLSKILQHADLDTLSPIKHLLCPGPWHPHRPISYNYELAVITLTKFKCRHNSNIKLPKSSLSFNPHITTILTVVETAEWPWISFVLLHTFITVLAGKTLGHTASIWCMKTCSFIYFKVTFAGDIFKNISFLPHWKRNHEKNYLLNSSNTNGAGAKSE